MKKVIPVICICAALILVSSCKNIMEGAALRDEIKNISNKSIVTVLVQNESSAAGYFSNAGEKQCTVGDSLELEFTVNADYTFNEFFAVDKETGDDLSDCVEFTPVEERQKGTFKIYKYTARITKDCRNLWIQAMCSWDLDNDKPEFIERNGFKICAARNAQELADGNYIELECDYYDGDLDAFKSTDRDELNKCRLKEVHVKLNGTDLSNRVTGVRVTETQMLNNLLTPTGKSGVFDEKVSFKMADRNVYTGEFAYKIHNAVDGYYRLDFQVIDAAGNASEEKISYYVIKDTRCYPGEYSYYFTPKPVRAADYSSESRFSTYSTDKDIIPVTLYRCEKDYWFTSSASGLCDELSLKALVSYDDKIYEEVPFGTMTFLGEQKENCVDISGYDRYRGFYIKFEVSDDLGNTVYLTEKQVGCPLMPYCYQYTPSASGDKGTLKVMYTQGAIAPSTSSTKYFYLIPRDGSGNLYKTIDSSSSSTYVTFTIDLSKEYDLLMISSPSSSSVYAMISELHPVVPDQLLSNSVRVKNRPEIEYEAVSNGTNSGTYTIRGRISNYNEIFNLYGDETVTFEPLYTSILRYDSSCLAIMTGPDFEFTLPYSSSSTTISFYSRSWNNYYTSSSKDLSFAQKNTAPVINSLVSSPSYSAERNRFSIYITDSKLKADSVKMYIDDSLEDLTEEQILNLPVRPWEKDNFSYYYFNKAGLEEKIYHAYVYAEDIYGNYAFKKFILNNITVDSCMSVTDTGALERNSYQSVNPSDTVSIGSYYCNYDSANSRWKWTTAGGTGAEAFYKKACLAEYSNSAADTGYTSVPFVWYAQPVSPVYKKLICSGTQLTLCYDYPVLYEVIYCKDNLGNNADVWCKVQNTITSVQTYNGCTSSYYKDAYSGTVFVEQLNPETEGTMEFKNLEIDTQYIPDGTYYTVLVHFADGTKTMSDVWYKY